MSPFARRLLFFRVDGEFLHEIDVQKMPFDMQSLKLTMVVNCAVSGVFPVSIKPPPDNPSFQISKRAFALGSTWLLDRALKWNCGLYKHEEGPKAKEFSCVDVCIQVSRLPGFYIVNIVIPMAFAAPLAMLSFFIPRGEDALGERLSCSLSVLLTTSAYKYLISSMIPRVSYLTLLDRYVLGIMLFVAVVCIDSADIVHFRHISWLPFDVFPTLIVLSWLIFNCRMGLEVYRIYHLREGDDSTESEEHEEQIQLRRKALRKSLAPSLH